MSLQVDTETKDLMREFFAQGDYVDMFVSGVPVQGVLSTLSNVVAIVQGEQVIIPASLRALDNQPHDTDVSATVTSLSTYRHPRH